jgi:hypothetical protein
MEGYIKMKKLPLFLFSAIVLTLLVGTQAFAQNVGDRSNYYVTYFSNANTAGAPDGTLRLINDGTAVTTQVDGHVTNGNLYASIYMFDDSQEMQECCNCVISPDGLLSESIDNNLLNNTLTGRTITRGVIKIISGLNPDPTNNALKAGMRGYMSHVQSLAGANGTYYVTETQVPDGNLISTEKQDLEITCGFVEYLGSGQGVCSCTQEGSDF